MYYNKEKGLFFWFLPIRVLPVPLPTVVFQYVSLLFRKKKKKNQTNQANQNHLFQSFWVEHIYKTSGSLHCSPVNFLRAIHVFEICWNQTQLATEVFVMLTGAEWLLHMCRAIYCCSYVQVWHRPLQRQHEVATHVLLNVIHSNFQILFCRIKKQPVRVVGV